MSLLSLLRSRENGCNSSGGSRTNDYCRIAEDLLIKSDESEISNQHLSTPLDVLLSHGVKSTIAIAMSPDGSTFATTHGDHTIKIFDYYTRKQIRMLEGHPRTPWTVKYHPTDPNIVASGCIGFNVKVWDISTGKVLNSIVYESTVFSLSFHPSGNYIAVAAGKNVHTWNWLENPNTTANYGRNNRTIVHHRNIRAVLFHPNGEHILCAASDAPPSAQITKFAAHKLYSVNIHNILNSNPTPLELKDFPLLIPQIHLYGDGGLDISQDGQFLLTGTVLWIPPSERKMDEDIVMPPLPPAVLTHESASSACITPLSTRPESLLTTKYISFPGGLGTALMTIESDNDRMEVDTEWSEANKTTQLPSPDAGCELQNNPPFNPIKSKKISRAATCEFQSLFYDPSSDISSLDLNGWTLQEGVCLLRLTLETAETGYDSQILKAKAVGHRPFPGYLMKAVTSTKLSPTGSYGLIAYGVRNESGEVEEHPFSHVACELIDVSNPAMTTVNVMEDAEDEVNVAQFHPASGGGIVYGTKRGLVRIFNRAM